jgi:hydrogenase maturation factor
MNVIMRNILERSVLSYFPLNEDLGLDAGNIRGLRNVVVAHSPSIGVPLNALGFFAFHYSASNVAAKFGKPLYLVVGIYLPPDTKEIDLRTISKGIGDEARKFNVNIVAGQTATYSGIEIPLITSTCIGEELRIPRSPSKGDLICVVGEIGGEALWLKDLTNGRNDMTWSDFTPLPNILRLQNVKGIKLMHDVSEGGVKKALHEITEAHKVRIDVDTNKIPLAKGVERIVDDPFRLPSYGALLVIITPDFEDVVMEICKEIGAHFSIVGVLDDAEGLYMDGKRVDELKRIDLDRLYGTFKKS